MLGGKWCYWKTERERLITSDSNGEFMGILGEPERRLFLPRDRMLDWLRRRLFSSNGKIEGVAWLAVALAAFSLQKYLYFFIFTISVIRSSVFKVIFDWFFFYQFLLHEGVQDHRSPSLNLEALVTWVFQKWCLGSCSAGQGL